MKQHGWADNSATQTNKKAGADGKEKEGTFSDAAEQAKKAFFIHRANADKTAPSAPATNLAKKMQSSGG